MCGVPVHAAEGYLLTLIRKGFRVAVCEQMEDPAEARKRGSKSVVRREVVRLVTPGTLTEDSLLEARRHNYLAAFAEVRGEGAFAWVDVSTGDLTVAPCPRVLLGPMLARLAPREVLVPEAQEPELRDLVAEAGAVATPLAARQLRIRPPPRRASPRPTASRALDGFAAFGRAELGALGAIVDYLELTQRGRLPLLRPPVREARRRADADRRRDPAQPRAHPQPRRRPRRLAARRHRPHGDRRRRAAAGDPAERPLDRRPAGPRPPGRGRRISTPAPEAGAQRARPPAPGARPRAGAVAARARPRRPARPRGDPRRAGAGRAAARHARAATCPRCSPRRAPRSAGHDGAGRAPRRRRSSPSRRSSPATAASSPRATTPSSTRPAGCATRAAA